MSGPAAHLPFGGSTAHRWMRCPGYVPFAATLPPQVENAHMSAGTHAHALLELALRERRATVHDFVGLKLHAHRAAFEEDDVAAVQVALDFVNGILDQNPDADYRLEVRFRLSEDVGGTTDILIYIPSIRLLHVIDYKHGFKYVEAEGNPQLKLYASAAMFVIGEQYEIAAIRATIVQPRCPYGEPVRTAVYGPADLIAFTDEVEAAVAAAAAKAPSPALVAGHWCDWCPCAHVCPAVRDAGLGGPLALGRPTDAWTPPIGDAVTVTLPPPGECRDPAKLAETLAALPVLEAWIDAVRTAAEQAALGGATLPGYKLVEKVARRQWADEVAAKAWFAAATLLDEDDYAPRKLLSPAQAEALVKAAGGKDAVRAMAEHVIKRSSGLKLVPETAKGDAVSPAALGAADFAAAIPLTT